MAQRKNETDDEFRARRRAEEQRRRDDPETNTQIKAQQRTRYANGGRERQRSYYRTLQQERFFAWRARLWSARHGVKVTEQQLVELWNQQHAMCALSARALEADAHLDHIIPASRGGTHDISNLRWLDPAINVMRGAMSDETFIALCTDISNAHRS